MWWWLGMKVAVKLLPAITRAVKKNVKKEQARRQEAKRPKYKEG